MSDVEAVEGVNADEGVMTGVGPARSWGVPMVCILSGMDMCDSNGFFCVTGFSFGSIVTRCVPVLFDLVVVLRVACTRRASAYTRWG